MIYLYYGDYMNILLNFLINYNKNKLNKLIEAQVPYALILKQSQKLDKLILKAMKKINRELV